MGKEMLERLKFLLEWATSRLGDLTIEKELQQIEMHFVELAPKSLRSQRKARAFVYDACRLYLGWRKVKNATKRVAG